MAELSPLLVLSWLMEEYCESEVLMGPVSMGSRSRYACHTHVIDYLLIYLLT